MTACIDGSRESAGVPESLDDWEHVRISASPAPFADLLGGSVSSGGFGGGPLGGLGEATPMKSLGSVGGSACSTPLGTPYRYGSVGSGKKEGGWGFDFQAGHGR